MIKKIVIPFILLSGFINTYSQTAFNYSQEIVKKENELGPLIESTEDAVSKFLENGKFDSIAIVSEKLEKLVAQKIREIVDMPAPLVNEGEFFKAAAITYFDYIKSMYSGYKDYGRAKTAESRDVFLKSLIALLDKKDSVLDAMKQAQQKFATANNFKLGND